jgi:hypothetical protein
MKLIRLFTAPEMKELNRCRIFLQVFFISDVVDIGGTAVEEWAPQGKQCGSRTNTWKWSVQQRPTKVAAWKRLLEHIGPEGVLVDSLGKWVTRQGHKNSSGTWAVMPNGSSSKETRCGQHIQSFKSAG